MSSPKGPQKMRCDTADFAEMGNRARWFAEAHLGPMGLRKRLASALRNDHAAARIVDGRATSRDLHRLVKAFGWRALNFLYEGVLGPYRPAETDVLLDQAIAALSELKEGLGNGAATGAAGRPAGQSMGLVVDDCGAAGIGLAKATRPLVEDR